MIDLQVLDICRLNFFSLRNGQSVIVVLIMLFLFTFDTAIVKLNISINPNASSFGENA